MPLVQTRRIARSLFLTLSDTGRQNALSAEMVAEIEAVLDTTPPGLATLVIQGEGGVFSAGADLKALAQALAKPSGVWRGRSDRSAQRGGRSLLRALRGAALRHRGGGRRRGDRRRHGARRCGGYCHRRSESALRAHRDEPRPAAGADRALSRSTPRRARRRRLALTGARLDGAEAAAVGLADFCCATEEELRDRLVGLLASVERCAPGANAETKRLFRACRADPPNVYIETAAKSFAAALRGDEGREGVAAFAEKRRPAWMSS